MDSIKSMINAFKNYIHDEAFLSYDDGSDHYKPITISFQDVIRLSQQIVKEIRNPRHNEVVALYFDSNCASILGIVPAIIAILEQGCAFVVFDHQLQPLKWIRASMSELNIKYIITNQNESKLNDIFYNSSSE